MICYTDRNGLLSQGTDITLRLLGLRKAGNQGLSVGHLANWDKKQEMQQYRAHCRDSEYM